MANMEDNIFNEKIENNSSQSIRKGSSRRIVTKSSSSNVVTKQTSKVRQSKSEKYGAEVSKSEVVSSLEESLSNARGVQDGSQHAPLTDTSTSTEMRHDGEATTGSAYRLYKAAGDWWNVFPKTDYTYSKFSTCRKELAPGVWAMPNMSRPPLHSPSASSVSSVSSVSFVSAVGEEERLHAQRYAERHAQRYAHDHSELRSSHSLRSISSDVSTTSSHSTRWVTAIYSFFWRIFSSIISVVTSVFRRTHDVGFESSWARDQRTSGSHGDGLLSWLVTWYYKSACYFLLLDAWLLNLFHRTGGRDSTSGVQSYSSRRTYYLLLLLLPLLLAGLLSAQGSSAPAAAVSSSAAWLQAVPTLWWGAVRSLVPDWFTGGGGDAAAAAGVVELRESPRGAIQGVDGVEELVQKVLASPQLQAALGRAGGQDTPSEDALLEQQRLHDRLLLENSIMRSQLEELTHEMTLLKASAVPAAAAAAPAAAAPAAAPMPPPAPCCRVRVAGCAPPLVEERVSALLRRLLGVKGVEGLHASLRGEGKDPDAEAEVLERRLGERLEERLQSGLREHSEQMSKEWLAAATAAMEELVRQEVQRRQAAAVERDMGASTSGQMCANSSLSLDQVRQIVKSAINLYDADKTGLVDYALESAGGTVINIRCTETYHERSLALAFLGFNFPWSNNHPRLALQPEVHPGQCWAFRGAQGWLVVRLSKRIHVTAFSLEHIPPSISPAGNIDAAPKNFSVFGLDHDADMNPILLGKYVYENPGPSLQYFPIQKENVPAYQIVELAIESNHGNLEYTCLYRFRVHGIAA